MQGDNYIKMFRSCIRHRYFSNVNLWHFYQYCILKASRFEHDQLVGFQTVKLCPGQFVFGRKKAAQETGLTERNIRTCLLQLEKDEKLTIKSTNKYSIITVNKFNSWQESVFANDHQYDQVPTSNRPASDQQPTTNKKEKKEKNKTYSAKMENSFLTHRKRILEGRRLEWFEKFWEAFDYKRGKAAAADAWLDIPALTTTLCTEIIHAAAAENSRRSKIIAEGRTPKMAQGWITERRWEDDVPEEVPSWKIT